MPHIPEALVIWLALPFVLVAMRWATARREARP